MKKQQIPIKRRTKWDKKSSFWLLVVIMSFVIYHIVLTVIPEYLRTGKAEKFEGKTIGLVSSIHAIEAHSQDLEGFNIKITSYDIDFIYKINGKEYSNNNRIPNNIKYKKFIYEIKKSNYKREIPIKYSLIDPQKSLIIIE